MQYATRVTSKGQATIPVSIRRKLGIKSGQSIVFEDQKGRIVVQALPDLESLKGSLKSKIKYNDKAADRAVEKFVASEYAKKWQK